MIAPKYYGNKNNHEAAIDYITELYEEDCFDLPLYLSAIHTFKEYNHGHTTRRKKSLIDLELYNPELI